MKKEMFICNMCPRKCNIDRSVSRGFCGAPAAYKVARAGLHFWEEPCISGKNGSGTVFFSGCSLKCVFCQNEKISRGCFGKEIPEHRLIEIFDELTEKRAHNINLVSPTHYAGMLAETLEKYERKIPFVYNTGGYDCIETLKTLDGKIDIYLTDLKYMSEKVAAKYSSASDYPAVAVKAVMEMQAQTGKSLYSSDGIMQRGIIVRHLVLPGNVSQAMKAADFVKNNLSEDTVFSLMGQYMPCNTLSEYPVINRRISRREYETVLEHIYKIGLKNVYTQELESSVKEYVPDFDLSGV